MLAIFIYLGWRSARQLDAEINAQHWVNHTFQVMLEFNGLVSDLANAETGERGFVITGNEQYLEPYSAALHMLRERRAKLKSLTADNSQQQARLASLEPLIDGKLTDLNHIIELRRQGGFEAAAAGVRTFRGKELMDQLREKIARAQDEEQMLL